MKLSQIIKDHLYIQTSPKTTIIFFNYKFQIANEVTIFYKIIRKKNLLNVYFQHKIKKISITLKTQNYYEHFLDGTK